jgi:hypothetical protein
MVNIITCFEDNRTARKNPDWVAVSEIGKAVRSNKIHRFLWDSICPSVKEYKMYLFDIIKRTLESDVSGIHLDGIGFPRSNYCTCKRCTEGRKNNNLGWVEWRIKVVNDFIEEASKIVKKKNKSFSVTLLPDPYFGEERYGQDFQSLSKYVDFFIVPLYDLAYSTTYWLETLAYAFNKKLSKPLYIELYATKPGPKLKNLLMAIVAVANYADGIILATHSSCLIKEIQEKFTKSGDITNILRNRGCESILNIIKKWE